MSQPLSPDTIDRYRAAPVLSSVPILVLHAHNRCNCRCVMCDIWKVTQSRALSQADIEPHLSSFRQLGVKCVVFTGGEPLMNPELPQLARMLRRENIDLTLLTTGILLKKFSRTVVESFDEVIVSLDGPPEIHDRIRRVNGAFSMLASGIESVQALSPSLLIRARTTVQAANFLHLRATVRVAHASGIASISFLAVDVSSQAFNRELVWPLTKQTAVGISASRIAELESEIELMIDADRRDINTGFIAENPEKLRRIVQHFRAHLGLCEPEAPTCNAPWVSAVIETDGTMRPCFFHPPIGNIHEGGFYSALNSDTAKRFRSSLNVETDPICRRCVCSLNYQG